MNIALIPARGGSKRIPRKNIKTFFGKPMIAWSILAARESNSFDRIIVSTDDEEIASVAESYGAEVPFVRPKELSNDYATTSEVVVHALQWSQNANWDVNYVCCIYATAPFLQAKYLVEAYRKLAGSDKSYAFSVTSFPFPIQRAIRINQQGFVEAMWPENISVRSQDLEETYHDAGQFYWGTKSAFLNGIPLFSDESIPVILPRFLVQDIDTEEDWRRAELMFQALGNRGD